MNQKTNIILIGFMGSGKTSAGIMAAENSCYGFIETDLEIEKYLNKKIPDIFAESGENYFRDVETLICKDASKTENVVISTGGGVVKRAENIKYLKQNGIIIYLNATPEHLYNNLKNDTQRPLLQNTSGKDRLKLIRLLLKERHSIYEEYADAVIEVTNKSISEISKEILKIGGNK